MKVRLLGLGAVGAPLAMRLCGACDFAILLSPDRVERYVRQGCTINGKRYDFPIALDDEDDVDLLIIACKNTDLASALETADHHVGANTTIMSLLNGIDSEAVLSSRYGQEKVIWSFITKLSSVRHGREIDLFSPDGGLVRFNEKDSIRTERIDAIETLFHKAGIRCEVSLSIVHDIWWKFAFNNCVNSLSAVMGFDYGQMNGNNAFYRLVRMLYREMREVASLEGITLTREDEEEIFTVLSSMDGEGKTSMLQDIEAGVETENRYFAGKICELARKHSVPVPLCVFLENLVDAASEAEK